MTERIVEMVDFICHGGILQQIPSNNISEEIVRCKDCEHAIELADGRLDCMGDLTESWDYYNDCPNRNIVPSNGFCFCGKRRED